MGEQSFADIGMMVSTLRSSNLVSISYLVTRYNYWGDDDGDGQSGVTTFKNLMLSIIDKNNQAIGCSDVLTICNAPYKVELSSHNNKNANL
ncbi:MAG: hypothetical protein J6567_00810 [Gilliamella sp.]|uniref:hypothetical protein n=1 Tax=Gilliamella sp. TaxID=1891236 RepID=UPI0025D7AD45|nr:hypothetical protein [Gilliamella sp.]MCO6536487.1 hypothetical protein [Gilliamella sp.]